MCYYCDMAGGRPSKYNPAWVEELPDMFADGQSVLEVAVNLGISKTAYYEYEAAHPEFADASMRGKELSQAWWERQGREGLRYNGLRRKREAITAQGNKSCAMV
jgi:hypothetical protein